MPKRDADPPRDDIAAAAQPTGSFVPDPHEFGHLPGIGGGRIAGAVLEPQQIARRPPFRKAADKPGLHPADCRRAIGEPPQLADRMERRQRIVGAGLNRQIAAGARRDQSIAVEPRQLDERRRAPRRQAEAVLAVLDENPGAKLEGQGQPGRHRAERLAAVAARRRRLAGRHPGRGLGPGAQQPNQAVPPCGEEVEGGEAAVTLRRRRDPALMFAPEGLDGGRGGGFRRRCPAGLRRRRPFRDPPRGRPRRRRGRAEWGPRLRGAFTGFAPRTPQRVVEITPPLPPIESAANRGRGWIQSRRRARIRCR